VLPFAVNAGTMGIAVLLLLTLPGDFRPVGRPDRLEPATSPAALRQELSEGLRWLRRHPDTRDVTVAVGVIAAMDAAWFAVLVLYVKRSARSAAVPSPPSPERGPPCSWVPFPSLPP
jgi:hypothetical protein